MELHLPLDTQREEPAGEQTSVIRKGDHPAKVVPPGLQDLPHGDPARCQQGFQALRVDGPGQEPRGIREAADHRRVVQAEPSGLRGRCHRGVDRDDLEIHAFPEGHHPVVCAHHLVAAAGRHPHTEPRFHEVRALVQGAGGNDDMVKPGPGRIHPSAARQGR